MHPNTILPNLSKRRGLSEMLDRKCGQAWMKLSATFACDIRSGRVPDLKSALKTNIRPTMVVPRELHLESSCFPSLQALILIQSVRLLVTLRLTERFAKLAVSAPNFVVQRSINANSR